jgi:hypothetical protein
MKELKIKVSVLDKHFVEAGSAWQGISQAEFVRRLIGEARFRWITHNLYQAPNGHGQRGDSRGFKEGRNQGEQ